MSTTLESISDKRARLSADSARFAAIAAILELEPKRMSQLAELVHDLGLATQEQDDEAVNYIVDTIGELLAAPIPSRPTGSLDELDQAADVADPVAAARSDAERDAFFRKYHDLKAKSGLDTIQAVAEAAGLSPVTVHAIENARTKPQARTLQKLAAAFGVSVSDLL